MKLFLNLVLWTILFVLCWPIAILLLLLYPIIWLLILPFRLLGFAIDLTFSMIAKIFMLPFQALGK
ncbi:hypothetical protein [Echinicola vietnamensis]|uniref:Uncharacterized protein n=1 Tax=Echinicola vietnamensis (strain DSM 17526 / LMG 23754 / KMM 6221) TaxID=926556 RepID=L0G0N7_ECHVK|nr:hypothetical protein [Echinicola vietnamensis]AGA79107.1 hypothetical protein Echvi_2868 [Echinicola vietnamensis DSM 17526]